ncbi:MAG: cysteine-rich small domain-containing protein [Defluviitaleaceae bacterium]|nr:cysteine-rich small domain-containing protein [Defluviitaleaceae bacterium]
MENNYRYFSNHQCKYFPCHAMPEEDNFNCLFCYCPLYHLGENCGGNFEYFKGTKSCTSCHLPHTPGYYDTITSKLKQINDEVRNAITD